MGLVQQQGIQTQLVGERSNKSLLVMERENTQIPIITHTC